MRAAAAAVKTTGGGAQVLAGYVVPDGAAIEPARARQMLASYRPRWSRGSSSWTACPPAPPARSTGPPALAAAGFADRAACRAEGMAGTAAARHPLGELLGVAVEEHADFFALGGTSLAAAQLVTTLRRTHPGVSVATSTSIQCCVSWPTGSTSSPPAAQPAGGRPAPHGSGLARMLVLLLTAR